VEEFGYHGGLDGGWWLVEIGGLCVVSITNFWA
jgi:hypothetical protein